MSGQMSAIEALNLICRRQHVPGVTLYEAAQVRFVLPATNEGGEEQVCLGKATQHRDSQLERVRLPFSFAVGRGGLVSHLSLGCHAY